MNSVYNLNIQKSEVTLWWEDIVGRCYYVGDTILRINWILHSLLEKGWELIIFEHHYLHGLNNHAGNFIYVVEFILAG